MKLTLKTKLYIIFKSFMLLSVIVGVYGIIGSQYKAKCDIGSVILDVFFIFGFTLGVIYYVVTEYRSYTRTGKGII